MGFRVVGVPGFFSQVSSGVSRNLLPGWGGGVIKFYFVYKTSILYIYNNLKSYSKYSLVYNTTILYNSLKFLLIF